MARPPWPGAFLHQPPHPGAGLTAGALPRPHADAEPGRWAYALKLLLEDATGQLDAILFGPDGDAFFAGLSPCDMRADPAAAAELQRCLNRLLGQGCQRWVLPRDEPAACELWECFPHLHQAQSVHNLRPMRANKAAITERSRISAPALGSTSTIHPACLPTLPSTPPSHPGPRDGGPWMDLCICVYFPDPGQPWQSRQYRLCDTTLTLPQPQADPAGRD